MRKAYYNTGWILHPETQALLGFSLGYDHCAEHEWGQSFLMGSIGISAKAQPTGLGERVMQRIPTELVHFQEYKAKFLPGKDQKSQPHAVFAMTPGRADLTKAASRKEVLRMWNADFYPLGEQAAFNPDRHGICVAWDGGSGFAIHARGKEDVERLKRLHEAFMRKDVALVSAGDIGAQHSSWSLAIASAVPESMLDEIQAKDQARNRLFFAASATGIEKELEEAKLKYYALSPRWRGNDESLGELLFFLNPSEQHKFAYGWFTSQDLRDWCHGKGPVVDGLASEKALREIDADFEVNLIRLAASRGVKFHQLTNVWADADKTKPGLRVMFAGTPPEGMIDGGCYEATELLRKIKDLTTTEA